MNNLILLIETLLTLSFGIIKVENNSFDTFEAKFINFKKKSI
jgi:hypothetical protein